jgi:hypothetical protein
MIAPDQGARCEAHVGEVFQPRCTECDSATLEASPPAPLHPTAPAARPRDLGPADAYGYCPFHPNYPSRPWPCDGCERDRQDALTPDERPADATERTNRT